MKQQIINKAEEMAGILENDYDVLLKKSKDNVLKIKYYKPKNLGSK